ncbi:hypothetical protein J1605_021199 [Eschrichtius robustus]|uniref:Uncharacterized protein n=1 Tax=Eschrichtius robustus TaxID=9764 RepID=A0AB34HGB7_ESCRO|nr:hypothetical protein J1605_021199 [Eschrichtius robustus]
MVRSMWSHYFRYKTVTS